MVSLLERDGAISGCAAKPEEGGDPREIEADALVVAAGGVGGNLELVRREWPTDLARRASC